MTPKFGTTSFISYPTIQDALLSVELRLVFKPSSLDDGLLLYDAYESSGSGDFIAVSLRDGHIVFQFDTGSGELFSANMTYYILQCIYMIMYSLNVHTS